MKTFEELEINEDIMRSVKELGFTTPFPIQAEAIPVLLRGTDVIGQAHTGTGKQLHLEYQCYKISYMEEGFKD